MTRIEKLSIDFDSRTEAVEIYNIDDFPYDMFKDSEIVSSKRCSYLNIPAAFDIETTTVEDKFQKYHDDKKHYIDVPDPNSYYYSFHHGHIDFSSLDECQKNSEKYLMMDVNDIYGSWCMEVQDENGKVLGAYLYLKCTSGNCDRYKGY